MSMRNWNGVFRSRGTGRILLAVFPNIGMARKYANDEYPIDCWDDFDPPLRITISPVRVDVPK